GRHDFLLWKRPRRMAQRRSSPRTSATRNALRRDRRRGNGPERSSSPSAVNSRLRGFVMRKLLAHLVAVWIAALPNSAPADPITLSAIPSSTSVTAGGVVSVPVFISGLGRPPAVG